MLSEMIFGASKLDSMRDHHGPHEDFWYGDAPVKTSAGVNVTEETALGFSAVWAATRLLAETVASLPCLTYRRLPNGGKERQPTHPLFTLLKDMPNGEMDSFLFFEQGQAHLMNWGNAFAAIQRDRAGRVVGLHQIHPSRIVSIDRRKADDVLVYRVRNDDATESLLVGHPDPARREMFHVTGSLSDDGLCGRGVIRQARESIGLALGVERFGATFFGNKATPGGVLQTQKTIKEEQQSNLRRQWRQMLSRENAHTIAILPNGMTYQQIGIPPEDAQFLQTRKFSVTDVARWYRVPPHTLADLEKATFSNISEQQISLIVDSVRPWLVRWEKAIKRQLIGEAERESIFVEFLIDAYLRGNPKERAEALQIQLQNATLMPDEWREIENRNPIPNGKGQVFLAPLNFTTLDKLGEEPEEPEPPALPMDDEEPEEDEPEPEEDEGLSLPQQAGLNVLRVTLDRLLTKELNAAGRASGRPKEWSAWLDEFYTSHEPLMRSSLQAPAALLQSVGIAATAENLSHVYCEESRKAWLLLSGECTEKELAEQVAKECAAWRDDRVDQFIEGAIDNAT